MEESGAPQELQRIKSVNTINKLLEDSDLRMEFTCKCFEQFDVDGTRQLEFDEVCTVVDALCGDAGVNPPSRPRVEAVFKETDASKSDGLVLEEFDVFLERLLRKLCSQLGGDHGIQMPHAPSGRVEASRSPPRRSAAPATTPSSTSAKTPSAASTKTRSSVHGKNANDTQPVLISPFGFRGSNEEDVRDQISQFEFPPFAPLPKTELGRHAAFEVACGRPLKELLPNVEVKKKSSFDKQEGWVAVRSEISRGYIITLAKTAEAELGCRLDTSGGRCLIADIASDGLIAEWNDQHPDIRVEEGDRVLAANSKSCANVRQFHDEISKTGSLELKLVKQSGVARTTCDVKGYLRLQEVSREGYRKQFLRMRVVPRETRCWWRICRAQDASREDRSSDTLNVHVQPLDVDGAAREVPQLSTVPLKPNQLRSMLWMMEQERSGEQLILSDWCTSKRLEWEFMEERMGKRDVKPGIVELRLELRLEQAFAVRGGVLADPIGSGKTLTCLTLCQESAKHADNHSSLTMGQQNTTLSEGGRLILQSALCAPEALEEIAPDLIPLTASLILCPEQVFHQWIGEVNKFRLRVSVFAVDSVDTLLGLDLPELVRTASDPVIVLAAYSVIKAAPYKDRCKSPLTDANWKQHTASLRSNRAAGASTARGMALEAFVWQRIIMDEFHELGKLTGHASTVLPFLQSSARWGLTGTPEHALRTVETARSAGRMFGCELNSVRSASDFVQSCFRTNQSNLAVEVEWNVKMVTLTQPERVIYQSLWREVDPDGLGARGSVKMLSRIVHQCSHFTGDSLHSAGTQVSAAEALHLFYEERRNRWDSALLNCEQLTMDLEKQIMNMHDNERYVYRSLQRADKRMEKLVESIDLAHKQAREAMSSYLFFHNAWDFVVGENSHQSRTCPICMEEYWSLTGALLQCGHTFCRSCTEGFMKHQPRCPLCRQSLSKNSVSYCEDLRALEEEESTDSTDYASFGSKLQCVVQTLLEVQSREPEARVLMFVQFKQLEDKVSSALVSFNIQHVRLSTCNNVFERRDILETFQRCEGPGVILLSLEESASGAHLTAASHVFLVHPMVASSPELARAYEKQAIGRAVRLGQEKKVTVWRFVTRNTVEEELTEILAGGASIGVEPGTASATSENIATPSQSLIFNPPRRER